MTSGQEFVKKIRPLGIVLFLGLGILVTAILFSGGSDLLPGYEPPHDSGYYAQHLQELKAELEQHVFPRLTGVLSCEITGETLTVTLREDGFAANRGAILQHFDAKLFIFRQGG